MKSVKYIQNSLFVLDMILGIRNLGEGIINEECGTKPVSGLQGDIFVGLNGYFRIKFDCDAVVKLLKFTGNLDVVFTNNSALFGS